ncbi:hypothetical protein JCM1841_005510 [Sporobolomyces salmonicolor]
MVMIGFRVHNNAAMDVDAEAASGSDSDSLSYTEGPGGGSNGPHGASVEVQATGKARKRRGQADRRLRRQAMDTNPKVHTDIDKQVASHKRRADTLLFRARNMAHSCYSDVVILTAHDRILSKANSAPTLPHFEHYFSHDVRDNERKLHCAARYRWRDPMLKSAFGNLVDESDPNWPTPLRMSEIIYELFGCIVQDKQELVLAANARGMQATVRRADEAMARAKLKEAEAEARVAAVEARELGLKAREEELERLRASRDEIDQLVVENLRANGVGEETIEGMLASMRATRGALVEYL